MLLLFHFLSLLLVIPLHVYYIFCSCPTVLGYSVPPFRSLFFSVSEVSNEGSSSSRFLSQLFASTQSEAFSVSLLVSFFFFNF